MKRISDLYFPTAPALLLIGFIALLPVTWLLGLSFVKDGAFSFAHYERVLFSGAYISIFVTTLIIAVYVTLLASLLGYPIAYFIYRLPRKASRVALFLIMLPLWTSVLARTFAWLILFQRYGPINEFLLSLDIIDKPLPMGSSMFAVTVGMTQIVLPLFVLPTLNSMRQIDRNLLTAATSLGAGRTHRFWSVFFPLTRPGIIAGALLTAIYSLGFFITPQILGGGKVVTLSMKVVQNATMYSEWGASSSLAVILLVIILIPIAMVGLVRQLGLQSQNE